MRPKYRLVQATVMVPVLLAMSNPVRSQDVPLSPPSWSTPSSQSALPVAQKSSPQSRLTDGGLIAYPSAGPASLSNLPKPQSLGKSPAALPQIGQVVSPYKSSGPPSMAAMATPQKTSEQTSGQPYLGAGGSMDAPSPYESTAAPGTTSPFANPSSTANANQAVSPSQAFGAAGGTEPNPFAGVGGAPASGLGGTGLGASSAFAMIGDSSPMIGKVVAAASGPPIPPPPGSRSLIAPSVRGFKIAENQSPVPQDRIFFSFNYYSNVNKTLDNAFQTQIRGIQIYRYVMGYEKTFNEGLGSVGIRVPLDNIYARSQNPKLNEGGDSTALGNLTVYLKHVFAINRETGSVASGGVAISPQTAPSQFGGARFLAKSNTTTIQPFFAFLFNRDRFYVQGFSALDVPVDPAQATLYYNDLGIGYYVYRDNESNNLITAVAPTLEVHINTPINHSGAYNALDKFGTPDIVNITSGLNTRFRQNSILTMGVVVPVTGPRPFSVEGTVLLNIYFGRSARNPAAPIIGG